MSSSQVSMTELYTPGICEAYQAHEMRRPRSCCATLGDLVNGYASYARGQWKHPVAVNPAWRLFRVVAGIV